MAGQAAANLHWLYLSVGHDQLFSGWMRLSTGFAVRRIPDGADAPTQQRRWVEFTRFFAERLNPSYGQIGIMHNGGDETTLESRLRRLRPEPGTAHGRGELPVSARLHLGHDSGQPLAVRAARWDGADVSVG